MRDKDLPLGSELDRVWMQRCLSLAKQAEGCTAPNPLVGSVVVAPDAQTVLGEGFHPQAGQPHAEIFALAAAGATADGATLYVNLEPCNHYGRTPPCTEAIVKAGIRRVVVGMVDPDPRVAGSGIDRLRQAGLQVEVGVEETPCQQLNEAFVHRIQYQRPFGIWKYAMTLDGKIATTTGHSAWVTGSAARGAVHHLRAICDAVIVGGNTVRRDNPHLTTHGICHTRHIGREPLRVVLSRSLDLPLNAHLWDVSMAPTVIFTETMALENADDRLRHWNDRGVEVVALTHLTPRAVFEHLYQRGFLSVLWECGGILAAEALKTGCIQKVWAFIAPKFIGGAAAPSPLGDLGLDRMDKAIVLDALTPYWFEGDLCLQGYVKVW
ncbi:MAG: bifunctional diaminohydroxyphosphoribosylaminopyrimidine deaminase/5-amino-6-(5-phosphoribosylamino)uracil reductase RibD [Prochlorotrichaceae cyanobacterium]